MVELVSEKFRFLLLLLLVLAVSGCGGKETVAPEDIEAEAFDGLREKIEAVVENPERQAAVLGLVDTLQTDFTGLRESIVRRRFELRQLNANYDATREQFDDFVRKYDVDVVAARKEVSISHRRLVEAATPEEWDALKKADSKAMKKLIGLLQSI